ncbi:MAG: LacI family DNA-binding transcriptional regulator, partial [Anaerolineales bacterium]|nr:LacI family DNA-binding transcriptional regulator [Anaerolineales bacterium]
MDTRTALDEIGEIVGISISTVLRVLPDPHNICTKVRTCVQQAVQETGYQSTDYTLSL